MKTKLIFLTIALTVALGNIKAQNRMEIRTTDSDISDNLDLEAVASIFGDSENLNDFERRLNEAGNEISNLDLNEDGYVDYLRVVEYTDNNTHLITIQAVLGDDIFQDIATIEVERTRGNRYSMIIVGNHYIYGNDYFLRPVYIHRPLIFSLFFGSLYHPWHSPYYWGYYPTYYSNRHPYPIHQYREHIYGHINSHHHYEYLSHYKNHHSNDYYSKYSRNDFGSKHPDYSFENRNHGVKNRIELDQNRRSSQPNRSGYNRTERSTSGYGTSNRRTSTVEKSRRGTSITDTPPTSKPEQRSSGNPVRTVNKLSVDKSENIDRPESNRVENKPADREKSVPTEVKRRSESKSETSSPKSERVSKPATSNSSVKQNKKSESRVKKSTAEKKVEIKEAKDNKSTESNDRR
jgi:hypothetical protein